jgi:hypothetical protein
VFRLRTELDLVCFAGRFFLGMDDCKVFTSISVLFTTLDLIVSRIAQLGAVGQS